MCTAPHPKNKNMGNRSPAFARNRNLRRIHLLPTSPHCRISREAPVQTQTTKQDITTATTTTTTAAAARNNVRGEVALSDFSVGFMASRSTQSMIFWTFSFSGLRSTATSLHPELLQSQHTQKKNATIVSVYGPQCQVDFSLKNHPSPREKIRSLCWFTTAYFSHKTPQVWQILHNM